MKSFISLEEAIDILDENVKAIGTEEIDLINATGRVLAEDVYSLIDNPPFNKSAMDGYAILAENSGSNDKIKIIDKVFAGEVSNYEVTNKTAIRIMTGAPIPNGANAVIKQEDTIKNDEEHITLTKKIKANDNICFKGEDIKKGSKLIEIGEKLSHVHIGIIASMGYEKVKVLRKTKVALISTGHEVICGGIPLTEGKIYDSNRRMIAARLEELGCDVVLAEVMGDDENLIANEIKNIMNDVDVVFTTGGVSVGKKDIMHQVIQILHAKRIFWRVNMKPGTPAIYAVYENKPLLCLSGNPFAAIATFELMGKQLLYKLGQDPGLREVRKEAILQDEFLKESRGRRLIRAIYDEGRVYLPKGGHSSGILGSMVGCNCLIDIKPGTPKLDKGEKVEVVLL